jgi:hypothetical protein
MKRRSFFKTTALGSTALAFLVFPPAQDKNRIHFLAQPTPQNLS